MHARIKNGVVVEYPINDIAARFPNTSLPADLTNDASLPDGYVYVRPLPNPVIDPLTQVLEAGPPKKGEDGLWAVNYVVRDMNDGEKAQVRQVIAETVRRDRDALLQASDWTQVADAPVDKAAWAAYRQALRDVTKQPGFPFDVNWPSTPV